MTFGIPHILSLIAAAVYWDSNTREPAHANETLFEYNARMEAAKAIIDARRKLIELSKTSVGLAHWAAEEKEGNRLKL